MRVVAVLTCFVLTACAANPVAPDLSFRVIGQAAFPAATDLRGAEPGVVAIRDAGAWTDFVQRSGLRAPSGRPEDPIPSIDFSSETAVVLLLGARPTSGYSVRVDKVSQRGSTVVVSAAEVVSCATILPVVTYPIAAIAVTRTNRTIVVEWSRESCR